MSLANLQTDDGRLWTVLAATIVFPLRGVGTARIEVDADEDTPLVAGPARLTMAPDAESEMVTLVGTIREEDVRTWEGRASAILVLGAGTLCSTELAAKTYQQAPFQVSIASLVADAVADAGETLSAETDLGDLSVPRWHRCGGRTARQLLDRLAERYGLSWRVSDAGEVVVIASETWPEIDPERLGLLVTGPDDGIGRTLETTVEVAGIRPGTAFEGRRIEEVTYTLDAEGLRVLLRYGTGEGAGGLKNDFERAARAAVPPLAYREQHAATVRRQNADGSLDVEADEPIIGGITAVPYAPGLVGCKLVFADGERVRLAFNGGDETQPVVVAIDSDHSAPKAAARVDDRSNCGVITVVVTPHPSGAIGTIQFTYADPFGSTTLFPPIGPLGTTTIQLVGRIVTGSSQVFLRGDS